MSSGDTALSRQLELVKKGLEEGNHMNTIEWKEYLLTTVYRSKKLQDSYKASRMGRSYGKTTWRSGLIDSEERMFS